MKILFTLDEAGDDLLKEVLGFSDANFRIKQLEGDIHMATDELIEVIGQSIYDSVVGISEAGSASEDDTELLYRTRLAIAINAYRSFAPDNDLGHTNSGRVMRIEDGQKIPFEWQIDRSNKSLERKYYKAVDGLLDFLDRKVTAWKQTQAYKDTHALFVRTTRDFDEHFDIGRSRLLLIKLLPGLRQAENREIKPRITPVRFDDMKTKLKANQEVDSEILYKIKEACVYKAIAWGLGRFSVQLFPEGVLQGKVSDRMTTQAATPALKSEPEAVVQKLERDAAMALQELEVLVAALNPPVYENLKPVTPYLNSDDKFITT